MNRLFNILLLLSQILALKAQCPRPEDISPCQCRTRGPTIQVRCTNSMIGRITDAMANLRRSVTEVDVLILEDNNIPHLPSRAFGSVKINRLFIENNRLMTIDRNAFAGIEDFLTELYIKESNLKSLPKDSVDFLHQLTVFSVENSQIMSMPKVAGLKKLKLFKIDGSQIRDIAARTLSDLPALRYLHVCRSALTRLDIGVLEDLRYLILANFTNNQINWIHPRAFRYMEQLEEVVLAGNKIKDASSIGRAMRVIKPLKSLDLSSNEIDELKENSFVDVIKLEDLNLSHNKLTELKRGAVHRMPRLKSVDLSFNRIRNFHSDAFISTPLIDELKLNNNQLTQINDVSFVLDALPNLRILDLSSNDIRDIPFGALRGYPALERLFLASNQISRVSLQALADMPSLIELDLSNNKLIADAIDGPIFDLPNLKILNLAKNKLSILNDQLLTTLNRLKRLDVSHNGISMMKKSSLKGVGQLDYLNISYNNLREIEAGTFDSLTNLFELDASHNNLVALPDYLLANQRHLEYVSFAYNQIQLISMHLFAKINRLKHLDLTSNFIMAFPENLINSLPHLEKLLFRRNSLQKLSKNSFKGLQKLQVLDLHDNRIQDIEEETFQDLINLKGLDLSLNIISSVGDTLDPLMNLMKLNLSDNYITSLPRNAFHSLEKLSTLDVSNNTIVEIGTAFTSMPQLKYLDISYNHLPMVQSGAFRDLPNLVGLRLDYNSIIDLQPGSFQDLWNLETLILTKNGISKLRPDTFRNLPSLEKLKLDDNLIESLERSCMTDLFSLKELHLQQNIIQAIDDHAFVRVPSLRHLNISYNLLQEIPRSGFYGLDTLETLDLSFNDLRHVDASIFDNQKWLVDLKLNDNNICRINRYAFRDTASLRSLSLKNNRLTRIPQEAFDKVRNQIMQFDVAGNPLTCDCETLWLRNWASDDRHVIQDEPICYFPSQLSGNPLRQLRTSRFTCSAARSSELISDACRGIPVKTPVQQHIQQGLNLGIFDTNIVTENIVSTRPLLESSSVATDLQIKAGLEEDNDIIDTEPNDVDSSTEYEYYYVYYDEEGNMIEKSPPKATESLNKKQDISLVDNNVQSGDTPTIYASLDDNVKEGGEKSGEDLKEAEDEGLSIFGIPIPKIPFPILSFGLAPTTLSHGLLPIGRKGEPEADANRRKNSENSQEITRGPDTIDPIWLETLVNGAKAYFNSGEAQEPDIQETEDKMDSYFPNVNGYVHPDNPIIPLTSDKDTHHNIPIVVTANNYYPDHVPALKFDHPLHEDQHQFYEQNPIQPIPELQQKQDYYQGTPLAEDGFIPLFLPNKNDPVRQKLPEQGLQLPYYLPSPSNVQYQQEVQQQYPLMYRKPPQQLPETEFPIVYAKPNHIVDPLIESADTSADIVSTKPLESYKTFTEKTTEKPYQRPTKTPPQVLQTPDPNLDYYYVYEDVVDPQQKTMFQDQSPEEIMKFLNSLASTEESTTERKVPTLQVDEVLPKREPVTDAVTSTTESTLNDTSNGVVYEYEYYYEYYEDPKPKRQVVNETIEDVEESEDLTTTMIPSTTSGEESSFSLKNIFDFFTSTTEEENEVSTTEVTVSSVGSTGAITHPRVPLLTPAPAVPQRPTLPPPVRTSTEIYDQNFLDNQRSSIQTSNPRFKAAALSTSSTPYPFAPDRLDPGKIKANVDNEVKWYYSNYHLSETLEPYVDPRLPRDDQDAAKVNLYSNADKISFNSFIMVFLPFIIFI